MTDKLSADCGECPVATSRRAFLRQTGLAVAAAVAATSLAVPGAAFAETIADIAPTSARGRRQVYPIPTADGISVDDGNDVILARWRGKVYAFSQRCPHKGAQLEWLPAEQRVFCPKHKSLFDGKGGHVSGRGSRDLDRYAMRREGGTLLVNRSVLHRSDQDPEGWRRAVVAL